LPLDNSSLVGADAPSSKPDPARELLPRVSVIIPLHIASQRFKADLQHCLSIDYADYEVIAVSDRQVELDSSKVKVIYTGKANTGPAEKRDVAMKECSGEVCAFIDDDAFPRRDWLTNAVRHFANPDIAAVGGPGLTPAVDGLMERAGGAVYASLLGSGKAAYRYVQAASREVDDYPAYNLLVRRSVLQEIGGFASTFYGGEDTKVCLSIVSRGKKIVYDPEVVVYHHRRPLFIPHLKQVANVGVHRGFFAKAFPETSRRLFYFMPPLVTIAFVLSVILSIFFLPALFVLVAMVAAWLVLGFVSVMLVEGDPRVAGLAAIGIMCTHLVYGVAFIRGLTMRHLDR
jgi:cellulose synthase/poly-beta-1,6-N-acetylglucosamine synthase-like glycosyltransferase